MKNIMIILNAVVYNRGSEALVRGLSKMCKKCYSDSIITLVSAEKNFGKDIVDIENIDIYCKKIKYSEKSIWKYISKLFEKIKLINLAYIIRYKQLLKEAKKQDIIVIVGADNYDIRYNMQKGLYRLNTLLRKKTNAKLILYDCSFDENDITDLLLKDIENVDYITVREPISRENISKRVKNSDKIYYYPDPAFVMDPQETKLDSLFNNRDVVGINVSDLITRKKYGSDADAIINSYHKLIEYILENTDMGIALIPHVMNNSDLSALKLIYSKYTNNNRVILIENEELNAKELKYIISKCKLYVGARTHSTIAAYSSCVPTLVLGYSIKSKGIAKDLFGTDEQYVLPVSNLDDEMYLVNGFKFLLQNEESIRQELKNIMPQYIKKAESVSELILKCGEGR